MWKVEYSNVRPEELDTTSSKVVNYVRRNIQLIEIEDGNVYQYEEKQIPKEEWELYEEIIKLNSNNEDVSNALIELADIVAEMG